MMTITTVDTIVAIVIATAIAIAAAVAVAGIDVTKAMEIDIIEAVLTVTAIVLHKSSWCPNRELYRHIMYVLSYL